MSNGVSGKESKNAGRKGIRTFALAGIKSGCLNQPTGDATHITFL